MSRGTKTGKDEPRMLTVGSLHDDRHGLMSSIGKIALKVFNISAEALLHIATGLEKLRRKQLVVLLLVKIDEAALVGWIVIPFDASDLDRSSSDLDF